MKCQRTHEKKTFSLVWTRGRYSTNFEQRVRNAGQILSTRQRIAVTMSPGYVSTFVACETWCLRAAVNSRRRARMPYAYGFSAIEKYSSKKK